MTRYSTSLYHPDPEAPAGQGRALRAGDVVAYHNIERDARGIPTALALPCSPIRWTLLDDPVADSEGRFAAQLVRATSDMPGDGLGPRPCDLFCSAFDIVGCGNLRLAKEGS